MCLYFSIGNGQPSEPAFGALSFPMGDWFGTEELTLSVPVGVWDVVVSSGMGLVQLYRLRNPALWLHMLYYASFVLHTDIDTSFD